VTFRFRWPAVLAFCLSLSVALPVAAQELSPLQFRAEFLTSLRAAAPDTTVTVEGDVIRLRGPDGLEKQIVLDQAYRRYRGGEDKAAVIDSIIAMALMPSPGAFREDIAFILVRPTSYLDPFVDGAEAAKPLYRPLAADLLLIMAQDHGHSFSYPPERGVAEAVPDLEAAWTRARDRTVGAFGQVSLEKLREGLFLLTAREDIAASLVLDPEIWDAPDVVAIGRVPAVAVFRDGLLIVDGEDPNAVADLRRVVSDLSDNPATLTDQLIVRRDGRWSTLPR
jgi:hypothetical protein